MKVKTQAEDENIQEATNTIKLTDTYTHSYTQSTILISTLTEQIE